MLRPLFVLGRLVAVSELLTAIAGRDREGLEGLLAEDVVFHSPVQTYRGRDQALHLLVIIGGIVESIEETRRVETITLFRAQIEDHPVDGMLDAVPGEDGRIAELTLMLRPLASLQAGVARMARALAELD
jgi:SnoaL-like protein